MTVTEDRLRDALRAAPEPVTSIPEPLADLSRRVARAKLRWSGVAAAVTAGVVLAIVLPLSLVDGGSSHTGGNSTRSMPTPVPTPRKLSRVPLVPGYDDFVTAGNGRLWTTAPTGGHRLRAMSYLVPRSPRSGKAIDGFAVPSCDAGIGFGLGRVWCWGGLTSPYPHPAVAAVDPRTGSIATKWFGHDTFVQVVGFGNNSAYAAASGGTPRVMRLGIAPDALEGNAGGRGGLHPGRLHVEVEEALEFKAAGFATGIYDVGGDVILSTETRSWVVARQDRLLPAAERIGPTGSALVGVTSDGLWFARPDGEAILTDRAGKPLGPEIQGSDALVAVIGDAVSPGFYVVMTSGSVEFYRDVASYRAGDSTAYTPADLGLPGMTPVADPLGGLVFSDRRGDLVRWGPG